MVPEYADMFLISPFVIEFDPIVFYLIYMNDIKFLFLIYQHSDRRTVKNHVYVYTSLYIPAITATFSLANSALMADFY